MLGQSRLVLRDLTPGRNLSLFVRCQAGPLQVATHPAMLPVGRLETTGEEGGVLRGRGHCPFHLGPPDQEDIVSPTPALGLRSPCCGH